MIKLIKVYKDLQDVAVVDNDGKIEIYAMVEDAPDGVHEETFIIDKLQTAFNIKINK